MSIDAQVAVAALYSRAFGAVFPGADFDRIKAMAQWMLDSYDTGGCVCTTLVFRERMAILIRKLNF
jgi:hypothetical protein